MKLRVRVAAISAAVTLLTGCSGGERQIVEPPPTGSSDFVLTISPDPEDAGVAQQLGWSSGIPGAEVSVSEAGVQGAVVRKFTSTATGTVSISALQSGTYHVSVRRLFTAAETSKLATGTGAVAFVGESDVGVSSSSGSKTIQVPASYRRSLVISEWSFTPRNIPGSGTYLFGGFLEAYNNSDTTIYLDGVLVAKALSVSFETPSAVAPCDLLAPYSNDPGGLWSTYLAAFPGSGANYPLRPGENVVLAEDAIDHSVVFPGFIDLSMANFEFVGSADVDNPAVPNMVDYSLREAQFGHGMFLGASLSSVAALAGRVDPASFMKAKLPPNGIEYYRLPLERILDVFGTSTTWFALQQPPITTCSQLVNAAMDRQYGFFLVEAPDDYLISVSRKILMTLPNGQLVLQHTRTSANDFQRTPRTPGVVR